MIVREASIRVVDALSGWGIYEARNPHKYPSGIEPPPRADERIVFGMEFVLRHAPRVVAELLCAELLEPVESGGAFRAEFEPKDIPKLLHLFGFAVTKMPDDEEHVQRLLKSPSRDPIICAVEVGREGAGPFVIFDGCHRAKAWTLRDEKRTLAANVIRTKRSPVRNKGVSPCDLRDLLRGA